MKVVCVLSNYINYYTNLYLSITLVSEINMFASNVKENIYGQNVDYLKLGYLCIQKCNYLRLLMKNIK